MNRSDLSEKLGKIVLTGIIVVVLLRPIVFQFIPVLDLKVSTYLLLAKSWSHNIIEFLILATVLFYISKVALMQVPTIKKGPVDLPILGFLFVCALSLIYSVNRDVSARSLLLLFSYVLFFYLVVHTLGKFEVVNFVALLVGLATIISLYGIYEYFFLYQFIEKHMDISFIGDTAKQMISLRRVGSVFGWPNRLAGFLGMTIPVSIALSFYERRPKLRILCIVSTVVMFVCMLLTFSISGWLALMGTLFFAAFVFFRLMGKKLSKVISRRKALTGVIILLLIIALAGVVWVMTEKRATAITLGAIKCRITYLKGALGIIRDNSLLGTGLGTFKLVYPRYMPKGTGFETWHAHNSYLEMWSEIGLAGLVLFLIFAGQLMYVGLRLFSNTKNPKQKLLQLGLISGITAFLLHNIMEFTFYCPEITLYWWLLSGLLLVYAREEAGPPRFNYLSKRVNRVLVSVVATILLVWGFLTLKNNFIGDIHFFRATKFIRAGRLQKGIRAYQKALQFNGQDSRYHQGLAEASRMYLHLEMKKAFLEFQKE